MGAANTADDLKVKRVMNFIADRPLVFFAVKDNEFLVRLKP